MLTAMVVAVMVVLRAFPETRVARWLDRTLIAALHRITRTHLIFLILMAVILIAGTELLAMAGPFDMALVLVWDVSAYVDIVLTTAAVAGIARGGAGWKVLVGRFAPRRAERARRQRAARKTAPPANDDERRTMALAA